MRALGCRHEEAREAGLVLVQGRLHVGLHAHAVAQLEPPHAADGGRVLARRVRVRSGKEKKNTLAAEKLKKTEQFMII